VVPAVTLTLSVLLCIAAMSSGSTAAAMARNLRLHGTTVSERESVALLLSSLNDAARKLCRHQTGQTAVVVTPFTDYRVVETPTALLAYPMPVRSDTSAPVRPNLLNLPPPVATI
jgi:hypothetical protein